jgi:hypothetical protein
MRTTPRPWYRRVSPSYKNCEVFVVSKSDWDGTVDDGEIVCSAGTADGHTPREVANLDLIVQAVNAFDALLAVAKEAELHRHGDTGGKDDEGKIHYELVALYDRLDAQHPGWRDWGAHTSKPYAPPEKGIS